MNYKERLLKDIEEKFKIQIDADIIRDYYWQVLEGKDKEIERLNNVIKDIKSQLDYLETYSSKEDVFEDMKRRLNRIDKIIGSDKE